MNKYLLKITILLVFAGFISCKQSNVNTEDDNTKSDIILDTIGNSIAEKELRIQLKDYLVAFNNGDADKAISYVYPDAFVYLKNNYPNDYLNITEIKDSLFIGPINKMKKISQQKHATYEFEIGEILKKVDYKNAKLFKVITRINSNIGMDKHSYGGEIIGISEDKGVNWKFMQNDDIEMTKGVLKLKFPDSVINKILEKNS